jgi:glucose/arabinose dehydrogenase
MSRLAIVVAVAALAACKDKGSAGERPSGEPPPIAPAGSAAAATGSGATGTGTTGTDGTNGTNGPAPAGSDELVQVPADIVGKVKLVTVAANLKRPVAAVAAPGDARKRLFVVEQHRARIVIIEAGAKLAKPFFDLGTGNISKGGEQGLLGLAFHPKFASNGKLYVNYTDPDDHTHVVEYQVSAANADQVDMKSAREVYFHKQPYSNHNGGHVLFGPDGKLYIGLGDGGAAGDPLDAGQDLDQELAKMLRLDVDAKTPKAEIVHYGLRNPWRYAFDAKTGDLFIADVGQDKWEYVFVVAGTDKARKNFGWSIAEGRHCYGKKQCDRSAFTEPVVDYPHDQGCSITGGEVYRGTAIPALDGVYFYADYCTNLVRSFRWFADPSAPSGGVARDHWDWRSALDPDAKLQSISSFGTDADGEMLIVTLTGSVFKLAPK